VVLSCGVQPLFLLVRLPRVTLFVNEFGYLDTVSRIGEVIES